MVRLFFDQLLVEKRCGTLDDVRLHIDAGLSSETHAPNNVCGHEVIALAIFPPAPTTVGVLEVVETLKTLLCHRFELFEIFASVRMNCRSTRLFDAAKDLVHRSFRLETEIA